ncbi:MULTISPECIES: hypothetical protein [Priestia]|uniref:Uncharacterized protein n=1 Tax=Priestia megaterium (strain ATCC 12872 / QMB1551) TaxID=545693 RepID=D5E4A3_PRIM1|nr:MULTISPECIES: hypothetical protein [Priestia]ADE72628.1 conserved hypothetical protein [Priestia megaterium QM B1551]MBG9930864.1 hypothetical protein [Priestia aryabhattai]MCT9853436.1 hypothetical protein [Priestia megaterium]MDF1964078.1 hypothetical protein [Priestia megaterium]MDF2014234.1 hypothetical protein [Priestia megaterium]
MKLYQVRKGQFVYYNNELHRVYSVKPLYKQSVHLIRLRDLTQHLTKAARVERYKPQNLDSFVFNRQAFTLCNDRKAEEGDYILITNPHPDSLDYYSLNEIEIVSTVEKNGVITTKSNGIRHSEYLLMVPGRKEDSRPIDYQDGGNMVDEDLNTFESNQLETNNLDLEMPNIGDVYKKNNSDILIKTMVVSIHGETIFLGGDLQLSKEELADTTKWQFLYNLQDK